MKVLLTLLLALAACGKATPAKATGPVDGKIAISVTEKGFEPDGISVKAGEPTTLVFTRKTDQTCAKEVIVQIDDTNKVQKDLPLDQPVEITATFPKAGKLGYACGMDMVKGVITVQ